MPSFLYRGSKDFEQNTVTGVIQAPCREAAQLFLRAREIKVYQLEVRPSTCTLEVSQIPLAPERPKSARRRRYSSRSEAVWGGYCWLVAFAFMILFAHAKPSWTKVIAANSQIETVSAMAH